MLLAAMLLTFITASSAALGTEGEHSAYLSPDSQGRYRPTIEINGTVRVLANRDSITAPAVSPNGDRVVFSGALGNGSLGLYALYLVNVNGSNLTQLTGGSYGEFDPVWINQSTIVFSQNTSGSIGNNCCRLASVNVNSGQVTALTGNVGAKRPAVAPGGGFVFWDNGDGVWRTASGGGSGTLIGPGGYDATVSGNEDWVAYIVDSGASTQIRRVASNGGGSSVLYSTSNKIENPTWFGNRIFFIEYGGVGYDGRKSVRLRSIYQSGGTARTERVFTGRPVEFTVGKDGEEILFYRADGLYRYYNIRPDASLGAAIQGGDNYTSNWSSIVSVNLDGDADDEIFFYRDDGLFRYYDIKSSGAVGSPILGGDGYTTGWTSISAVDLDGDGADEMFFYREDGLYRYYNIRPNGSLGSPIIAGDNYTSGWTSISAVDLDGDGQDEMFFYRDDGLYRYYNIRPNASLGSPISGGDNYPTGLHSFTAIDLDGDGKDEMLIYRANGSFEYRTMTSSGQLGAVIESGNNYLSGWTIISSVRLPR